jgi:uncharacterized membrane protein (UPF0127 family)
VRAALASGLALYAVLAAACRREPSLPHPSPVPAFGSGHLQLLSTAGASDLQVEIAETPRQRRLGLSHRQALREDAGMLFVFQKEQPRGTSFWMYRTYVPLSIAFVDEGWVIREIRGMSPCRSPFSLLCPRYDSRVPFRAALEVKRGYFTSRGIGVGDRVLVRRDPPP